MFKKILPLLYGMNKLHMLSYDSEVHMLHYELSLTIHSWTHKYVTKMFHIFSKMFKTNTSRNGHVDYGVDHSVGKILHKQTYYTIFPDIFGQSSNCFSVCVFITKKDQSLVVTYH